MSKSVNKIIVFDLDETLGIFSEIGMLMDSIEKIHKKQMSQKDFNTIMDLYPELLRPNIIDILEFIKIKKKTRQCKKVIIFTNNQGPKRWGQMIKSYFEYKINYKLFDKLIGAYKIGNIINETERTSHDKSYSDLKTISKINDNYKICFLDDQYHPKMIHNNIYYIYLPKYVYFMAYKKMVERFLQIPLSKKYMNNIPKTEYENIILVNMNKYNKPNIKSIITEKDIYISKQVINHLHIFFKNRKYTTTKKRKTKRNPKNKRKNKRTRKKY